MLNITRKSGQRLVIHCKQTGEVLADISVIDGQGSGGGPVKLGIISPESVGVDRAEVYTSKKIDIEVRNGSKFERLGE